MAQHSFFWTQADAHDLWRLIGCLRIGLVFGLLDHLSKLNDALHMTNTRRSNSHRRNSKPVTLYSKKEWHWPQRANAG